MVTGAVSRDDGAFDPQVGQPFVPRLGCAIADYVEQALQMRAKAVAVDRIDTAHAEFTLKVANRLFLLGARLGVFPRWLLEADRQSVRTELNVARLGPVALATTPGEVLPALGFEIKTLLGTPFSWVLNLANDELGYILPRACWNDPNYQYECAMSVGPDLGPTMLEQLRSIAGAL
jgi:hypothetical protein